MSSCIGIRREDKSEWERRVAIVPTVARDLKERYGIQVVVQPSPIRAFGEDEFLAAGAEVREDLSVCPIVFGVKEMPKEAFIAGKTYVFFSHVIEGPALQHAHAATPDGPGLQSGGLREGGG